MCPDPINIPKRERQISWRVLLQSRLALIPLSLATVFMLTRIFQVVTSWNSLESIVKQVIIFALLVSGGIACLFLRQRQKP
jgi:hypothetical protein